MNESDYEDVVRRKAEDYAYDAPMVQEHIDAMVEMDIDQFRDFIVESCMDDYISEFEDDIDIIREKLEDGYRDVINPETISRVMVNNFFEEANMEFNDTDMMAAMDELRDDRTVTSESLFDEWSRNRRSLLS